MLFKHHSGHPYLRRPLLVAAGVFLCSVVVAAGAIWQLEMRRLQLERARVSTQTAQYANAVQSNVERALSASYALAAMVRQGGGKIADFEAVAGEMLPFYPGVSGLFLAPGGVVRQATPLTGNEKAIGHDLLQDPARTKEAFLARDTGKLTLAGPFSLVQGGLGAAGRLPVFFGETKDRSSFWGFTAVLMRFPDVLASAGLAELPRQGLSYELWRTHPDTGQKQTIAASSPAPLINPVAETLSVPNASWTLSVAPERGWGDPLLLSINCVFGLLISLLMAFGAKMWVQTRANEAQLRDQAEQLGRTGRLAKVGGWTLDLEGMQHVLSPEACRILDLDASVAPGFDTWIDLFDPQDRRAVQAAVQAGIANASPWDLELPLTTGTGRRVWVRIQCDAVTQNGKAVRLFGTLQDITERKQFEDAREALEAQLRESQKMEALGTLAGGVAHDFNNALAAIMGNVELARQDLGPGHDALVSLEEIAKAGRRAKDLVQQILAFGRRQKLERKVMSTALVVVESARLVRATLPAMISLNVSCEADTPPVLADATQLKQILLNLCSNALQAVRDQERPGVIDIRLDAWEQAEANGDLRPGRYARLCVSDNGPGMDAATRSRIFEPFFTTRPRGAGTGLGLSVVYGIVRSHEAVIEVESVPGKGSTFCIYFPAVEAPVAEVAEPDPGRSSVGGQGKHVLYLDDEEAIIFLMKRLLERQGYRVSGYTEPRKALAAVRADPAQFDLAVTDYYMPGMSGLEVAQALKEIRPDLPVVMASGYITEELRAKAPAAGIRELIYKPNTVEDLCEAVARFANAQGEKSSLHDRAPCMDSRVL